MIRLPEETELVLFDPAPDDLRVVMLTIKPLIHQRPKGGKLVGYIARGETVSRYVVSSDDGDTSLAEVKMAFELESIAKAMDPTLFDNKKRRHL